MMTDAGRDLVFEHLKQELTDVLGGVETEHFWDAFDALEATASIKQLTLAGLMIKLRSLGSFLVGARTGSTTRSSLRSSSPPVGGRKFAMSATLPASPSTAGLSTKALPT